MKCPHCKHQFNPSFFTYLQKSTAFSDHLYQCGKCKKNTKYELPLLIAIPLYTIIILLAVILGAFIKRMSAGNDNYLIITMIVASIPAMILHKILRDKFAVPSKEK